MRPDRYGADQQGKIENGVFEIGVVEPGAEKTGTAEPGAAEICTLAFDSDKVFAPLLSADGSIGQAKADVADSTDKPSAMAIDLPGGLTMPCRFSPAERLCGSAGIDLHPAVANA